MPLNIPDCVKDWVRNSLSVKGTFSHNKSVKLRTDEIDIWMSGCGLTERQVAWLVLHGLDDVPKCRTCGRPLQKFELKGITHCSAKCAKNDPETNRRMKETNLARYGTEYSCQAESVKSKSKASCLQKYGVENVMQSEKVKERLKQSMLERYGTEYALQSEECQSRRRETCIERFGVSSPMQNQKIQEKAKQTNLQRYGTANPMERQEVRDKVVQTCLQRYGTANPMQNPDIRKKAEDTLQAATGSRHPLQNPETRKKAEATTMEHYGTACSLKSKSVQEKVRQTNLSRYGTEFPVQSEEVKAKTKKTNLQRYGSECSLQSQGIKDAIRKETRLKWLDSSIERFNAKGIDILSSREECIESESILYRCRVCGTEFSSTSFSSQTVYCPSCIKKTASAKEKDLAEFVKSICSCEILENTKRIIPPLELDICIPEKHLAIEFNGMYWHSSAYKERTYHKTKTRLCMDKGLRLIHVFEWEWDRSKPIVKSLISSALELYERTEYARRCEVREVSMQDYEAFLEMNHLQGRVKSALRLGLWKDGELLMCAGWGRSRFNSKDIELHRMCSKLGCRVIGGFSRLVRHSGLERFISYVDMAHFTGQGYVASGFLQTEWTPPGYKWIRNEEVISRQQAQKSRLPKLLGEAYNPDLTEAENMAANGWFRVFDCGNLKMEWIRK